MQSMVKIIYSKDSFGDQQQINHSTHLAKFLFAEVNYLI